MIHENVLLGGIEAGGTKFVCAVGTGRGPDLLARMEFPTGNDPTSALHRAVDFFIQQQNRHGMLAAIGIASFGPIDLNHASPTYGFITSTPKLGWRNTNMVGPFTQVFPNLPMGFDTDVNGAALGEYYWGNAVGLEDFVYVTIGTGIGAGGMARGRLLHGLIHPEMGHMFLPRVKGDDFAGLCPYHGACWEGLCSGPAIHRRTAIAAEELPPDHSAWKLETTYIGAALSNIICVLSPKRIIIGGSVRKAGKLGEDRFFEWIRDAVKSRLNDYVDSPMLRDRIDEYIVAPHLGDDAGVIGALALASRALDRG